MITLLEINKAINNRIKQTLRETEFKDVPILAEDISEPIVRPSLRIAIEDSTTSQFNAACRERTLICRIYFFAKNRYKYKFDNARMQEIIECAFLEGLEVKEGFFIQIKEIESEVSDTVLICSFDLYMVELIPEPTTNDIGELIEPMEEININLRRE
ncbi:MAG: hypothetical protein E7216_04825 [Clostridium thermopalmarium]|uniref:phage tail terminator family protein n=1 Tax=Clostridium thermopalmarium TaxID=29373 RepID=UPI00235671C1|nr:hypothetical protein [Clostridium thermopalmarium]MBE6043543.1 hypothetical protein [Clostridium thermopalmarium]